MPKTKRDKKISLTRTSKKGSTSKHQLVQSIKECLDKYARLFVFSVENMRNSKLKDVRNDWKHSRFYFGKNRVMLLALGKSKDKETRKNLHKVSESLKGQCGLLFTNKTKEEVDSWFEEYVEPDFARSGNAATETVILKEGPLSQFSHSLEPHLRQLGMPTALKKGVITLLSEHKVCDVGDLLTPDQSRILKLLGHRMASFKLTIECMWSSDGTFEDYGRSTAVSGECADMPSDFSSDSE